MKRAASKFENVADNGSNDSRGEGGISDEVSEDHEEKELAKQRSKRENGKVKVPDLSKLQKAKSMKAGSKSSLSSQFSEDLKLNKNNKKFVSQSSMKMSSKTVEKNEDEPDKEDLKARLEEKRTQNKKSLSKFLGGVQLDDKSKEKKNGDEIDPNETPAEALQRILISPECPKARAFEHQYPMPMILNKDQ